MAKENKPEPGTDVNLQKRRKIVKGIAGLPALVTLASGSGAANASVLQCVRDLKYRPLPKDPDRPDCIASGGVVDPTSDLSVQIGDDAARVLDGTNGHCLVYIDGNGNLVDPGTEADLVTTSCYTSFATSAINKIT